ncbi:DUF2793 domain-containing protein [Sphingobium sp. CFD-2]|uniref:DUF2793 domain-containing protein n=1 Tax=Sphingobium sp. CFD-2 TaxID=2878542 RepID=UPI00214C2067|nr:DUF2793 domain-containing protein [Sphingobium sp. CFD-2]
MTLPRTGAAEWVASQASPWDTVNLMARLLDAGACRFLIEDRDLTAPPGSCADGACYLVKATATGTWAGHDGKLAVAIGANASNGWQFITVAVEGMKLYVRDENLEITHDGSAWSSSAVLSAPSATIQASEALSAGQVLNLYTSGGAARIRKANATDSSKPANAFTLAAISSGASGAIYFAGQIITGLSSLTPGTTYYLDTTGGALTATPPSSSGNGVQQVGVALSATTLLFNPQTMIEV